MNIYNCTQYGDYLFRRIGSPDIEDEIANTECIYVRSSPWMLTTMAPTFISVKEFAQVQYEDFEKIRQLYKERKNKGPVTVVIDTSFTSSYVENMNTSLLKGEIENNSEIENKRKLYENMIQLLEDLEPETEMKELTEQMIFSRKMEVYLINP